jgi:arylsulfatase A-like enzyme
MNIHGQAVLQARRLVEAGVPLVTVFWQNDGVTNVSVYWDTHARNFIDLKTRLCPVTDQAFSALLDDLEARGLLDETLVVWTGEMGRTPKVGQSVVGGAGAAKDGRDHWPHVFTTVLAGGGIRGGIVYGASDRYAAYPADKPVKPADLAATIYYCLGIDPRTRIEDRLGLSQTLCEGEAIERILV